jgi:hypothetical protein
VTAGGFFVFVFVFVTAMGLFVFVYCVTFGGLCLFVCVLCDGWWFVCGYLFVV